MENLNNELVEGTVVDTIVDEVEVLDNVELVESTKDSGNLVVAALAIGAITAGVVGVSKFIKSRKAKKKQVEMVEVKVETTEKAETVDENKDGNEE